MGDYLFPWADDHLMMDGWDEAAIAAGQEALERDFAPISDMRARTWSILLMSVTPAAEFVVAWAG